jgi:hypothetical protein
MGWPYEEWGLTIPAREVVCLNAWRMWMHDDPSLSSSFEGEQAKAKTTARAKPKPKPKPKMA